LQHTWASIKHIYYYLQERHPYSHPINFIARELTGWHEGV